jgi:hypothetical protein
MYAIAIDKTGGDGDTYQMYVQQHKPRFYWTWKADEAKVFRTETGARNALRRMIDASLENAILSAYVIEF